MIAVGAVCALIPLGVLAFLDGAWPLFVMFALGASVSGVLSPGLAGLSTDSFGLNAIVWVLMGVSVAIFGFAFGLVETAPVVLHQAPS